MKNTEQLKHLNEEIHIYLSQSDKERIKYIRSPRWIGYPKAKDVINKLDDLLEYPQKHRMPNMLIIGDTNTGKTMIANRFLELNPAYELENNEGVVIPVLFVQAPPVPSESRFYSNILEKMFAPYKHSDATEKKQYQVLTLLRNCNVKMLVIDEIHSLLAGSMEKQRVFLSVIRNIGNELKIPIVGIGTKDALRAIKTDPQLDNRFKPSLLPRWEFGTDFRRLLASFERMIPLKLPSNLHDKQIARKLLAMSEGLLGELSEIISEAAIQAIKAQKEKIDMEVLLSLEWSSPSERKRING